MCTAGMGKHRGRDDLRRRNVVARRGLGADRADLLLQYATSQRNRAALDIARLGSGEELPSRENLEELG